MLKRQKYAIIAAFFCFSILPLGLIPQAVADDSSHEQERVKDSGDVMKELLNPSNGIPASVLNKSECVIVLPNTKRLVS